MHHRYALPMSDQRYRECMTAAALAEGLAPPQWVSATSPPWHLLTPYTEDEAWRLAQRMQRMQK